MPADTAAEHLLQGTRGRVAEIKAHQNLQADSLAFFAEPNRGADDTSPLRRLEVGCRVRYPEGLMLRFIADADRLE